MNMPLRLDNLHIAALERVPLPYPVQQVGATLPGVDPGFHVHSILPIVNLAPQISALWPEKAGPEAGLAALAQHLAAQITPAAQRLGARYVALLLTADAQPLALYAGETFFYDFQQGVQYVPAPLDPGASGLFVGYEILDAAETERYLALKTEQEQQPLTETVVQELRAWHAQFKNLLAQAQADVAMSFEAQTELVRLVGQSRALGASLAALSSVKGVAQNQNVREETARMRSMLERAASHPQLPEPLRHKLRQSLRSLVQKSPDPPMTPAQLRAALPGAKNAAPAVKAEGRAALRAPTNAAGPEKGKRFTLSRVLVKQATAQPRAQVLGKMSAILAALSPLRAAAAARTTLRFAIAPALLARHHAVRHVAPLPLMMHSRAALTLTRPAAQQAPPRTLHAPTALAARARAWSPVSSLALTALAPRGVPAFSARAESRFAVRALPVPQAARREAVALSAARLAAAPTGGISGVGAAPRLPSNMGAAQDVALTRAASPIGAGLVAAMPVHPEARAALAAAPALANRADAPLVLPPVNLDTQATPLAPQEKAVRAEVSPQTKEAGAVHAPVSVGPTIHPQPRDGIAAPAALVGDGIARTSAPPAREDIPLPLHTLPAREDAPRPAAVALSSGIAAQADVVRSPVATTVADPPPAGLAAHAHVPAAGAPAGAPPGDKVVAPPPSAAKPAGADTPTDKGAETPSSLRQQVHQCVGDCCAPKSAGMENATPSSVFIPPPQMREDAAQQSRTAVAGVLDSANSSGASYQTQTHTMASGATINVVAEGAVKVVDMAEAKGSDFASKMMALRRPPTACSHHGTPKCSC